MSPNFRRWAVRDLGDWDADAPLFDHRRDADAKCRDLNARHDRQWNPPPTLFDKDRTMSQSPTFDQPESLSDMEQIKRNQWGQPLITPADGGKAVGYQRVTTFIKVMESSFGLEGWKLRQVACGLAARPDLRKGVDAHAPGYLEGDDSDKKSLDEIVKQALDAAASSGKATIGTALHRITERIDRGLEMTVPDWAEADVAAYRKATAAFDWLHIERMHVNDALRVAGTPDRIAVIDGVPTVVDLKTGSFWASSCATQLGIYANSDLYDIKTARRIPTDYRKDRALVIHLPAGTGEVRLRWVDTATGYAEASDWAPKAHKWQKRRDLDLGDYTPATPDFAALAAMAGSVDDLMALHGQAVAAGCWDDAVKAAFSARKAELAGSLAA